MKEKTFVHFLSIAVLLAGLFGASQASAQQISISPTRVVMDADQRSAELVLSNRGDRPGTYRIVLTHKRMNEDGRLVDVTEDAPSLHFADELVRYAPRQVVVQPHSTQRIRVMLRNSADIKPGEYRSRLAFQAVPEAKRTRATSTADSPQIKMDIQVVSGITIPLIVRKGNLSARSKIENLKMTDDVPASSARRFADKPVKWASFDLTRAGNRSIYGDIVALWVPEEGATPIPIAKLGGVAVYTELDNRNITLPIISPAGESIDSGQLIVGFKESGSDRIAAQQELNL